MSAHDNFCIISILASDRVGLIHDITRIIADLGGDLADTRQQILQGYFSMIMAATFPAGVSPGTVRERLSRLDPVDPVTVTVRPVKPGSSSPARGNDHYVLTARGADRIGFVALVSGFCADHGINILDLATTGSGSTYTMILLVDLSGCPDRDRLRDRITAFNRQHGLTLLLQHSDIFQATNEIRMS